MILKQSTIYTRQFLMVLTSDHVSPATGKSPVVKLGKAGSTGVTATNSPATEVDPTNLPGVYSINLSATDTSVAGDLAFNATAASCDNTTFVDQIQTTIFTDLSITGAGRVFINDNLIQNGGLTGWTFMMVDSTTSQRKSGLTVTAQRTLGAGGFAPCTNAVSEIGSTGIYSITFSAADTNSGVCGFLFTAAGAADLYIPLVTTP